MIPEKYKITFDIPVKTIEITFLKNIGDFNVHAEASKMTVKRVKVCKTKTK